jgi:UDP-3-O-[3-hydroxymyristoyl] glucosamine N-acyltransferase
LIGGQVGISGHLTIGNVRIQAQSGVGRNIKDNEIVQGAPFGYNDFSKSYVHFKNLPKIVAEIEELKNKYKKNGNNG